MGSSLNKAYSLLAQVLTDNYALESNKYKINPNLRDDIEKFLKYPRGLSKFEKIVKSVKYEREKQFEKWGEQNHLAIVWIAILTEEVGEAAKEVVDYHCKNPVKNIEGNFVVPANGDQAIRLSRYRRELIQVAAVAIQMIECLDRKGE